MLGFILCSTGFYFCTRDFFHTRPYSNQSLYVKHCAAVAAPLQNIVELRSYIFCIVNMNSY